MFLIERHAVNTSINYIFSCLTAVFTKKCVKESNSLQTTKYIYLKTNMEVIQDKYKRTKIK